MTPLPGRSRFLDSLRSLGMTAVSFRAQGRRPEVEESLASRQAVAVLPRLRVLPFAERPNGVFQASSGDPRDPN
jgi:hypothetical protein